jgi:hypothetical protein
LGARNRTDLISFLGKSQRIPKTQVNGTVEIFAILNKWDT